MASYQKMFMMVLNRTYLFRHTLGMLNRGMVINVHVCQLACGASFRVFTSQTPVRESAGTIRLSVDSLVKYDTIRYRSKKQKTTDKDDDSNDEEEEEEEEFDGEDLLVDEEVLEPPAGPPGFTTRHMSTLRSDSIISNSFSFSNRKSNELFYASKYLLNNEILLKKSKKVKEEDTLDVVMHDDLSIKKVKRVQIVKILDKLSKKGNPIVWVRIWKAPFEANDY